MNKKCLDWELFQGTAVYRILLQIIMKFTRMALNLMEVKAYSVYI